MTKHKYLVSVEYTARKQVEVVVDDLDSVWDDPPSEDSLRDEAIQLALRGPVLSGGWVYDVVKVSG